MLVKQEKTYRHTPSASSGDAAEFEGHSLVKQEDCPLGIANIMAVTNNLTNRF